MNIKTILLTTLILLSFVAGSAIAAAPAAPTTLTNTSGAGWVQWDWDAGTPTDNVTDTYNVSRTYDSATTWFNGTTNEYIKWTSLSGETVTIYVFAYNSTYGEISTSVTDSVVVPMMFSSVVNLIAAIIPLFAAILNLIIAVFPLVIAMAFLGGLAVLISRIFNKSFDFWTLRGKK